MGVDSTPLGLHVAFMIEWLKDKAFAFMVFSPLVSLGLHFFGEVLGVSFLSELGIYIIIPICLVYLLAFVGALFSGDLFSGSSDKYGGGNEHE